MSAMPQTVQHLTPRELAANNMGLTPADGVDPWIPPELPFKVGLGNCTIGPNGQVTAWVFIEPETAHKLLMKHNKHNREQTASKVNAYTKAMNDPADKEWMETHQGVGFDWFGQIVDGQKRLCAITNSQKGRWMLATFNLDPRTRSVVDTAEIRTRAMCLQIFLNDKRLSKDFCATAGHMLSGMNNHTAQLKTRDNAAWCHVHREAIRFASLKFPTKSNKHRGLISAPLRAVFARAWYCCKGTEIGLQKLEDAVTIYLTGAPVGDVGDEWRSLSMLRDRVLRDGKKLQRGELYNLTEAALRAFLDGRRLANLRPAEREMFPIPFGRLDLLPQSAFDTIDDAWELLCDGSGSPLSIFQPAEEADDREQSTAMPAKG